MKKTVPKTLIKQAVKLAESIKANSILLLTENVESYDVIAKSKTKLPIVVATAHEETFKKLVKKAMINTLDIDFLDITKSEASKNTYAMKLTNRETSIIKDIEEATALGMKRGVFGNKDLIVVLTSTVTDETTGIVVYEVKKDQLNFSLYEVLKKRNIKLEIFEAVLNVALDIGREGREGKLVGTAFLVGDSDEVMRRSKQLILNPFAGHLIGERVVTNHEINETIKELSQIDGVFIVSEDGVIESAGRYLNVDVDKVDLPPGLGSMHAAVFVMTKETSSIGITVSKSGGIIRILENGVVIKTLDPHKRISL